MGVIPAQAGILPLSHASIDSHKIFKDEEMDQYHPCVYILTNKPHGVLYIGVTSNPSGRVWQHNNKQVDGFSKRYNTDRLVWYEFHTEIYAAINREKQLKKWNRAWKIEMIEPFNPTWQDCYSAIVK